MQNIYIVENEDPFSVNAKNDWDTPEPLPRPKLTITIEDVEDDEEGFLADLDAQIAAFEKENITDEKIEILGSSV